MTIKSSGPIALMRDIVAEFGGAAPYRLSDYYRGGAFVPDTPANANIPTSGRIRFSDFYGASKIAAISFVGAGELTFNNAAASVSWPTGTTVGDMAVLVLVSNNTSYTLNNLGGWSADSINGVSAGNASSNYLRVYSKVLVAGDLSSPPSFSGGGTGAAYFVVVYRGGAGIAFKGATGPSPGTTVSVAGFAKSPASSRVMSIFVDRTNSTTLGDAPTGWTRRHISRVTYHTFGAADVESGSYTDNAAVVWTGLQDGGASFQQAAVLYELS